VTDLFSDSWRQAEAGIMLFVGAVAVDAFDQGALLQFTKWPWIQHPTFQVGGGHCTTELIVSVAHAKTKRHLKLICKIFRYAHKIQQNFSF